MRRPAKKLPYVITDRRPGDIAISYADPAKANKELAGRQSGILSKCVGIHIIVKAKIPMDTIVNPI